MIEQFWRTFPQYPGPLAFKRVMLMYPEWAQVEDVFFLMRNNVVLARSEFVTLSRCRQVEIRGGCRMGPVKTGVCWGDGDAEFAKSCHFDIMRYILSEWTASAYEESHDAESPWFMWGKYGRI